jgi:hypothetical protein
VSPVPSGLFHSGLCPRDRPLKRAGYDAFPGATGSGALIRGAADRFKSDKQDFSLSNTTGIWRLHYF